MQFRQALRWILIGAIAVLVWIALPVRLIMAGYFARACPLSRWLRRHHHARAGDECASAGGQWLLRGMQLSIYVAHDSGEESVSREESYENLPGLLDYSIGPREHDWRNCKPDLLRSLEIDDQLKIRGLLNGKVGGLCALQYFIDIGRGPSKCAKFVC